MEVFVVVFVAVMAWGLLAAVGRPYALKAWDVLILGVVLICCVAAFALFVALPIALVGMIMSSAFV